MHAPRRIKDYKIRLQTAFKNALMTKEFKEEFKNLENCLSESVYGKAARTLGINWYEGTTDKPCDAIHIIGKDLGIVASKEYFKIDFTKDQTSGQKELEAYAKGPGIAEPTWVRLNWPGSRDHQAQLQERFTEEKQKVNFKKEIAQQDLWVKSKKGENQAMKNDNEDWFSSDSNSSSVFMGESSDSKEE